MSDENLLRPARLTLFSWLKFLFGQRDAILDVARSHSVFWLGLLFVLSAGLAREYDGVYLAAEPWHLLLPLVVSLATSAMLYSLVYCAKFAHGLSELSWWSGYRTLLTFYWLTAPLAWLYAIPVERFLEPADAVKANLGLLAIVSLWRVLLITRALSVWLGARFRSMIWIVLFFAATVVLILNTATRTPIWDVMGGIRLSARDQAVLDAKLSIWIFGIPAWFILGVGAIWFLFGSKKPWSQHALDGPRDLPVGISSWLFAAFLLVTGVGLLAVAQSEQKLAWRVEQLLEAGQLQEAVRLMSQEPRDRFPPHWSPPPHVAYGESEPSVVGVLMATRAENSPNWVRDVYFEKLLGQYSGIADLIAAAKADDVALVEELLAFLRERPPRGEFQYSVLRQLDDAGKEEGLDPAVRKTIREFRASYLESPQAN